MMASLSRTTSHESTSSASIPISHLPSTSNEYVLSSTTISTAPLAVKGESTKGPLPAWSRTPSHSLLPSAIASATSRKSRFAEVGTTGAIGRASISMPPPMNKPSSTYKPSASRRPSAALVKDDELGSAIGMEGAMAFKASDETAVLEDAEKTPSLGGSLGNASETYAPLTLPDSTLKHTSASVSGSEGEGNRLSLSSLYSLGSAIYNGATGGSSVQSIASSNAGSASSAALEHSYVSPLPMSQALGPAKGEVLSSATTATDPVSVTANAHSLHIGQ